MDTNNASLPILKTIGTTEDAAKLIEYIDAAIAGMYQTERANITRSLEEILPENLSIDIKNYLSALKISLTNHEEVRLALTALQNEIRKTDILTLTLSVNPTKKMLDAMTTSIKEQFGAHVVAEITINQQILGGAIVIFKGKYVDQSLKRKLDILFDAKKDEIIKLIQ